MSFFTIRGKYLILNGTGYHTVAEVRKLLINEWEIPITQVIRLRASLRRIACVMGCYRQVSRRIMPTLLAGGVHVSPAPRLPVRDFTFARRAN